MVDIYEKKERKKYPQNMRALRILSEELLQPIFARHQVRDRDHLDSILGTLSEQRRTSKAWVDLNIRLSLMIQFTRTTHEPAYSHLVLTIKAMLPHFFAVHKPNYAR